VLLIPALFLLGLIGKTVQVGDNVVVKPRRQQSLVHRLAKITRISDASSGSGLVYHIHEYTPARETFLGFSARPDEVFATNHSDTVSISDIMGIPKIYEVKDGDDRIPQEGHLPDGCHFFAS
jgi:hypothetical protein